MTLHDVLDSANSTANNFREQQTAIWRGLTITRMALGMEEGQ